MYVLGKDWQDGYLDYHLSAGEARVAVKAWWVLEELTDRYNPQPRSLRRVWNYMREVGVRQVVRKTWARLKESVRDRPVIAAGVGEVVEGGEGCRFGKGARVLFIAPAHPRCAERVVLGGEFLADAPAELYSRVVRDGAVAYFSDVAPATAFDWDRVAGWSKYSGWRIDDLLPAMLKWAGDELARLEPADGKALPLPEPTAVRERSGPLDLSKGNAKMVAGVSGLGNLTKTVTLYNLPRDIRLACIHEINPVQIGRGKAQPVVYDTSDSFRPDEKYDVYLIAGYHHTHPDLAIFALRNGGWVIVEKPLVTTREQLDRLLPVVREHPGRLFIGFHMRYNPLYALAREDLGVRPGEPIHSHCIVYEIPLARRHWYNWPNAGSRIISNACHWIDHFLFMNDWSEPVRKDVWKGGNGDIHLSVELANSAVFGMCLTDMGSPRIGMQEHVELRANGVTVKVDNSGRYVSENVHRIIRRERINKLSILPRMQRVTFRKILSGEPGDSTESIQRSTELMLDLEEMYQSR